MRQRTAKVEETDARKKFSRFKKEEPKAVKELKKVGETETLREIRKLCEYMNATLDADLGYVEEKLDLLAYTADDVEKFSIMMKELEGPDDRLVALSGFMQDLVYRCNDDNFVIHTSHLRWPISFTIIGHEKTVTVMGDLIAAGDGMDGGKIIVNGDVGVVGEGMTNGEIHIEGEYGGGGNVVSGRIYHKGELVVDK